MTRTAFTSIMAFGFLIFSVLFIRIGFFLGIPVHPHTLILSFLWYITMLYVWFLVSKNADTTAYTKFTALGAFIVLALSMYALSFPMGRTYDLSWDGQGYHQSAVIALKEGWNPVSTATIPFRQKLPSQIFAEGYPSALWEIQSAVYALVGRVNAGKILNIYIALTAIGFVYVFLRRIALGKILSLAIAAMVVLQPVFLLQALTFMQDGFGYELLVIAIASLAMLVLERRSFWPIVAFFSAELLLVTTKYSHLPVAVVLAGIGMLFIGNRLVNGVYHITRKTGFTIAAATFITCVFLYLPYIRNIRFHGYAFYPTNIPELMGSVTFNNTPLNLRKDNKIQTLFYGMFSRSQTADAGDPTNPANIARLKIPFTFSRQEITDSGGLFNNRVGAGGPLYSGLIVFSILLIIIASLGTENRTERFVLYGIQGCIGMILLLSLVAPTPNLFRYTNELQLIPFVVLIPLLAWYKRRYIVPMAYLFLVLIACNIFLFTAGVAENTWMGTTTLHTQLIALRASGTPYTVKAQQFYSAYTLLSEQHIPFSPTTTLSCNSPTALAASSNTTHYCPK